MMGMGKRDAVELWCVFLFSAVLLVVFYCASPAENPQLLRSGLNTLTQYDWQSESPSCCSSNPSPRPQVIQQQQELEQEEVEEQQEQRPRRVAICLVGGLRAFQLTGPSIGKYLLDVYSEADLFVHAPVDTDVHKLTLLTGRPHLASVKLFVPSRLDETQLAKEVLTASGSPNGIQGLLQYFKLVEGCWGLIEDYEARHNFKYDWVIRSRVDGFWNGPMPPIEAFNSSRYYVPYGSDFGGLNDRLGVGTRATSEVALRRMSLLPQIHQQGYRDINSEASFKAQFNTSHVEVELNRFPFCVLSVRTYKWPIGPHGIPVASISSKGALNGAKCRPCKPSLVGGAAQKALNKSSGSRGAIGPTDDAELCDAHLGWEKNWEQIYDAVAGPDLAEVRQSMSNRTVDECMEDMQRFHRQWEFWSAPSAEDLCIGVKGEDSNASPSASPSS